MATHDDPILLDLLGIRVSIIQGADGRHIASCYGCCGGRKRRTGIAAVWRHDGGPGAIRPSRIFSPMSGRGHHVHHHAPMGDPERLARYQAAVRGKARSMRPDEAFQPTSKAQRGLASTKLFSIARMVVKLSAATDRR